MISRSPYERFATRIVITVWGLVILCGWWVLALSSHPSQKTPPDSWDPYWPRLFLVGLASLVYLLSLVTLPDAIRAERGRRRVLQGRCPRCRYSLIELESFTCPECGNKLSPEQQIDIRRAVELNALTPQFRKMR